MVARSIRTACTLFSVIILAACSPSQMLTVETEPPGAQVTIKAADGRTVATGRAPVTGKVRIGTADEAHTVSVTPAGPLREDFQPATVTVDPAVYQALPQPEPNRRTLQVRLDRRDYAVVMGYEVVLTRSNRWIGVVVPSRAYFDVAETGGSVPGLIVDFGDKMSAQAMALSPRGDRIVYSAATFVDRGVDLSNALQVYKDHLVDLQRCNIHRVSTGGGVGVEQITSENFLDMFPVYTASDSPRGQHLLFSTNRRRPDSGDILRMHATIPGGFSDIYVNHRDGLVLKPTQASDGTIAFGVHPNDQQHPQIWTIGGANQFPTHITLGYQPQISPDGKYIAYIGLDRHLWVVGVDRSNATQLTSGAAQIVDRFRKSLNNSELGLFNYLEENGIQQIYPFSHPSWTPDGRHILFTSMEGTDPTGRPNEDIWIIRYDGSGKQQLTTNGSSDRFPLISPDMKSIYFMSNRGKRWAIWRIEAPSLEGRSLADQP
jgi:Tol biopolymer transport system component